VAVAFALGIGLGRLAPAAAIAAAVGATYVAPVLLFAAFGGVSDYHTMAIWLAPIAGLALSRTSWSRWHIPAPWRLPFVTWGLLVAVTWPVIAAREIDFSLVAAHTYDTTTGAYAAPPRLAAAWILIVALTQLVAIVWFDLLWARFAGQVAAAERLVIRPLIVSACIGATAALYQSAIDPQWMNLFVWSSISRVGALMLDANTAAMTAVMWAPVVVALGLRAGSRPWLGVAAYLLLAAGLWGTGSRTGLLALSVGTAGVVVAAGERLGFSRRRVLAGSLGLGGLVIVAALAIAPQTSFGSPLRRVFDRLPRLDAQDIRRFGEELWLRFGYAQAAATMTAEHPISGVGVGAFHVVAPEYLYRAGREHPVADNAQNWWRHQVAELGFLGSAPLIALSLLVLVAVWRGLRTRGDPVPLVVATVVIGVGLASLVGVPTQHPATLLAFLTLLFWLAAMAGPSDGGTPPPWQWMLASAVVLTVAAGQLLTAQTDLRVPHRVRESQLAFAYGLTPPEGLSEFGEFRWAARKTVAVLPIGGPWLQLTIWAPQSDVAANPVRYTIALEGREVISQEVADREPRTFYLEMPRGTKVALLELRASRDAQPNRAVQIATIWRSDAPGSTPPDRVIRN
jgi:O-antigen ligase